MPWESEANFRETLDSMLEGCQVIGFDWKYLYLNEAAAKHNRRPNNELLGRRYMDMWPGIEATEVFRVIQRSMDEHVPQVMQNEFVFPDGDKAWFDLRISPTPKGVVIFSIDITERKRAEEERHRATEALSEIETQFRVTFEQAAVGIAHVSLDGRWLRVNPKLCDILGFSQEEFLGKTFREITHPDDLEADLVALRKLVSGELQTYRKEKRYTRKDGVVLPITLSISVVRESSGKPRYFISIVEDIAQRKQAEEALRESEERFRSIVEGAPDAIFIQTESRFAYLNPAACRLFGAASANELLGSLIVERVYNDFRDKARQRIRQLNEQRKSVPDLLEQKLLRMDGSEILVETVGEPIVYEGKTGALVFVRDVSKRREAERARVESESRFQLLAETAPIGIVISDKNWKTVYISRRFVMMFGYTIKDIPSVEEWWSLAYPDERERNRIREEWNVAIEKAEKTRSEIEPIEYAVTCRDGRVRQVEFRMATANDLHFATFIDISERKRAEEAVRASTAKLETALESMTDAVFISDVDGNFINFNEAFATFHRFGSKAECARTLAEYPAFLDVFMASGELAPLEQWAVPRALRGETATNAEYSLRRKDTGETWIGSYSFAPIRDKAGAIVGSVVVGRDITERRQAEMALRESESRFRNLVNAAPDSIYVHSEGRFLFLNPAMLRLLGAQKPEEMLGTEIMSRIAPEYHDAVRARIRLVKEAREMAPPMAQEFIRLDGTRVPVEAAALAFRFEGKDAHLVFARDITDRRLAEQEQANLQAQLLQAQKMESVGRLAGGVAHDFNNILTVQRGYCEILKHGLKEDDPLAKGLAQIDECAERAATLTRQLLAFSRKQTMQPRVLDMNALVKNLDRMLRRLIGEDVELSILASPTPAMVKADPGQIEQVIINLAVNARDAMPEGGKLSIQIAEVELDGTYSAAHVDTVPGPYVMLAMTDTGTGMDEETKRRIFEPFFTTKGEGKGTGLGLSTVYGIVRQSGGTVWVYSELGRGTTFKVYLPLVQEDATQLVRDEVAIERGQGELVLVVEDEQPLRELAKLIIENLGYKATVAANGGEALILVEEKGLKPNLVLTDVVMPGMSGRVLVERLRKTVPNVKVIYMSGYTDDAAVRHGVLEPEMNFLQKPFTVSALAAKLKSALKKE